MILRHAKLMEISGLLSGILGTGGRPASPIQIRDFMQFASVRKINLNDLRVVEVAGRLLWTALPVTSPGRTMLLFVPPGISDLDRAAATALLDSLSQEFRDKQIDLVQVLLDPLDGSARGFFAEQQFVEIAELIYLQGNPPRSFSEALLPLGLSMHTYSAQTHDLFARAITESYRNSLDCPAINGMRSIEDVILGHKSAGGEFDPALWRVICEHGEPRGAMLLSTIPMSDALELVYLGLAPSGRGRGLGDLLMREAMQSVVQQRRRRLTLAVDARNGPALKLYYRHGLHRVAAKTAMIRDLRKTNPLSEETK